MPAELPQWLLRDDFDPTNLHAYPATGAVARLTVNARSPFESSLCNSSLCKSRVADVSDGRLGANPSRGAAPMLAPR